jgi:serine/threonine-protein kinase
MVDAALAEALRDRYRLERELGRGGMAVVYLAHDLKHDRPVALKVLRPELAAVMGSDRFLREIRTAARLQHPHILPVHDSGEDAGRLWFAMPYVEGESLRDRLERDRQLPIDLALRIGREAAEALHYAHTHGIVHRDVKPENILLSGGHALVADFGVAMAVLGGGGPERLTETGVVVGTPQYMSPEQASGERDLGPASDVYALGCVLYEMLAGEPPHTGPTAQAILARRLLGPVPSLMVRRRVPAAVEGAVGRALAQFPADRFATANELARALETAAQGRRAGVRVPWAVAWLALGLLLIVAGYLVIGRDRGVPLASAAVLPFEDLSPAKDQAYFSDGLTEELITTLSQVPGLRVPPPSTSFQFRGRSINARDVGARLGVATVLEGSVRKSGDRLRVSAQLVSVRDGFQLWAQSYDRDLADVFSVQEEISRAIVAALRVRLTGGVDAGLASRPTADLEAYEAYLKGRFAWNQRTEASLPEAVAWFEQATARDSGFARAWAGLADATLLLPSYASVSPTVTWPRARAAAGRALTLDSTLADAWTSLAYGTMLYEWDWARAEDLFRRAIAADSNYATAHHWYADYLTGRGRLNEALREMRRAHELDPLSRIIGAELAWVWYTMGRNDEAVAQAESTLRVDPGFAHVYFVRGLARFSSRDLDGAIADLRHGLETGGFYAHVAGALVAAHAAAGDRATAERMLEEMTRRGRSEYVAPFALAVAYTGLGRWDEAIDRLLEGIEKRDIMLAENFSEPLLDPLRSHPRFGEVMRGMGLPPRR